MHRLVVYGCGSEGEEESDASVIELASSLAIESVKLHRMPGREETKKLMSPFSPCAVRMTAAANSAGVYFLSSGLHSS